MDDQRIPAVRIFVSSPGDVAEERAIALGVIRRLQGWFQGRLLLVPILWEQEPLLATAGFQQEIDRRAPPSAADIAIFVLWSRLGTPLAREFALEDGRRPTGTEWEFVEARRSNETKAAPHILVYKKTAPPPGDLAEGREAVLARLDHLDALEGFFQRHFRDRRDLSFTGSFHQFDRPSEFGLLLQEHLTRLLDERLSGSPPASREITWRGSPFRGLDAFEPEHAPIFFGRSRAIQEVVSALRGRVKGGCAFVLVLGASGTGKSSLVRGGILPLLTYPGALEEGAADGFCRRAIMRPADAPTPIEGLFAALLEPEALPELSLSATELAGLCAHEPSTASLLVANALRRASERVARDRGSGALPTARLVLVIDQLEELFTRSGVTEQDRDGFARIVEALARSGVVWVLATLRSDLYPLLAGMPAFLALKAGSGQYDLLPPDAAEIGQIVRLPAQVAGLSYERDPQGGRTLDEVIVAEAVRAGADVLPLLEYALQGLYERSRKGALTFEAYGLLGGIDGAVGDRAEAEWKSLSEEARGSFPSVLRTLVEVGEGPESPVSRRRAPWIQAVSTPGAGEFVSRFVAARLLVAQGEASDALVYVAHEAFLRRWPVAARQLEAEVGLLRIRTRARAAAALWEREGRAQDRLLAPGKPIEDMQSLVKAGYVLTQEEQAFLDASEARARMNREERDRGRRAAVQARALALVHASSETRHKDPMLALLLAREAVRVSPDFPAVARLREALADSLERVRLVGHTRPVKRSVFSRSGAHLLTASGDMTARLWDVHGVELAVFRGHRAGVEAVAFSPDEQRVLTGSWDSTARLWDLAGKELALLAGHQAGITHVAFSPSGERILTVSADGTARLWGPRGDPGAVLLPSPGAKIHDAVFSPSGDSILVADGAGKARAFDCEGRERSSLPHPEAVRTVCFAPKDGRIVTTSDDRIARVWDERGVELARLGPHAEKLISASFTNDGQRVVTVSRDGTVVIWDAAGREVAGFREAGGGSGVAAHSPAEDWVLTGSGESGFRLWPMAGGPPRQVPGESPQVAAFAPRGDRLVIASKRSGASLTATRDSEAALFHGHADSVDRATFSPQGDRVFTASRDGTARVWDAGGELQAVLRGHEGAVWRAVASSQGDLVLTVGQDATARLFGLDGRCVASIGAAVGGLWHAGFSPRGDAVLAVGQMQAALFDVHGIQKASFRHEGNVTNAVFAREGDWVMTTSEDRTARVWTTEGESIVTLRGHEESVHTMSLSPAQDRLLTCSRDGTARLWDLSGHELATFRGHDGGVSRAVFSRDSDRIVTSGADRTIRVWDLTGRELALIRGQIPFSGRVEISPTEDKVLAWADRTACLWDFEGRCVAVFSGHEAKVQRAAFSRDGTMVLTPSADGTARLWSASGTPLAVLRGHQREVNRGIFSPRGDRVLTCSKDGTARLWFVRTEDLLGHADARITRELTPEERERFLSPLPS